MTRKRPKRPDEGTGSRAGLGIENEAETDDGMRDIILSGCKPLSPGR